ncbi:MAG: hypothetical protein U1E22_05980, partial [Coriobacteriia bacterium]|nr:hypothetical protein [Coriobacteriia bacterium]
MSQKPVLLMLHLGADLYGSDLVFLEVVQIASGFFRTIAVLDSDGPLVERLQAVSSEVRVMNLGVLRRANASLGGAIQMATGVIRARRGLRSLIVETDAAGVYSNTLVVVAGALAAHAEGVPHVWHVHEHPERPQIIAVS